VFHDYEQGSYDSNTDDHQYPKKFTIYPDHIDDFEDFDGYWLVPAIVRSIYRETLVAIRSKSYMLSGLGLRATIEAICNHQNTSGKSLDVRITSLAAKGMISKKDAELLHGIRFLGNDAAHEMKLPKPTQVAVADKIIRHLLQAVYVLPSQAKGELEHAVSDFDEFISILEDSLESAFADKEQSLKVLLGPSFRRVVEAIGTLEPKLIESIKQGKFTKLELGIVGPVQSSPKTPQLYKIS
jgi:hypothetical protein